MGTRVLSIVVLALVVAGCAAGNDPLAGTPGARGVAGLWFGLRHGMIRPIAIVASLFTPTSRSTRCTAAAAGSTRASSWAPARGASSTAAGIASGRLPVPRERRPPAPCATSGSTVRGGV